MVASRRQTCKPDAIGYACAMREAPTLAAPARQCGDCAMCCRLGEIADFKPYNAWCQHCSTQKRCDSYETRPEPCRSFHCLYVLGKLAAHWNPLRSHMVVSPHRSPTRITVLVDPETPLIWREAPYLSDLQSLACEQPVTVMVGYAAYAVYPDRIETLGETTHGRSVVIHEQVLQSGAIRYLQALHSA